MLELYEDPPDGGTLHVGTFYTDPDGVSRPSRMITDEMHEQLLKGMAAFWPKVDSTNEERGNTNGYG